MTVEVGQIDADDRTQLRRLARLERALYGGEPRFVPELDADVERRLSGRTALCEDVEQAVFAAREDGEDVARCVARINRRWQQHHGRRAGFVGDLVTPSSAGDAVAALLAAAERWLGDRGADAAIAGYSSWLVQYELRTGAHDEDPVFPFGWDPPWLTEQLRAAGYRPVRPAWSYRLDPATERCREAVRPVAGSPACTIRRLDKRRWRDELALIARMFNETFCDEWEFHPIEVATIRELYDPFKPVADPDAHLFAEIDREPAGFCLGGGDLTSALRRAGGRLGPLGGLAFALRARRAPPANVYAIGVLPSKRRKRVGATLLASALERCMSRGGGSLTYHLVNDDNHASRRLAESFGGAGRALHHSLEKPLP